MEVKKSLTSLHIPSSEKTYKLSALIDVDSFFYAILDDDEQVARVDYIKLSEDMDLKKYFRLKSAKIAVANRFYTLIPEADYSEQSLDDYVHQVIGPSLHNQYVYQVDHVKEACLYVCYAMPISLYQYCFNLPAIPIIHHQVSALLTQVSNEEAKSMMHVSRYQDLIIIIAFANGQLYLANTFESRSPITTLYYITLVQKELGIKKRDVDIEFSGDFIPGDETERLVSRYYNNLSYRSASLRMDDQLLEQPSVYFPLQSVSLCG